MLSIEEQIYGILLLGISLLKLLSRQPFDKGDHGLLHVHDTPLLLVNVRCVDDDSLEIFHGQRTWWAEVNR